MFIILLFALSILYEMSNILLLAPLLLYRIVLAGVVLVQSAGEEYLTHDSQGGSAAEHAWQV